MFVFARNQKEADEQEQKQDPEAISRGPNGRSRRLHSAPPLSLSFVASSSSSTVTGHGVRSFRVTGSLTPQKVSLRQHKPKDHPLMPGLTTNTPVKAIGSSTSLQANGVYNNNSSSSTTTSTATGDVVAVVPTPQQAFERFQQRHQQFAKLLHVHPLSNAIEFTLDTASLQVSVVAWWKDLQRQTLFNLQQRHGGSPRGGLSSLKQLKPKEKVLFFSHAMLLLIECWDQVQHDGQQREDGSMLSVDTQQQVIQAVAKVFVKLISKWIRSSTSCFLESIGASMSHSTHAQLKHHAMIQFVNVLIQCLPTVGRVHPAHGPHKLICSSIRRAFNDVGATTNQTIRWKCSCCDRIVVVPLSNAISEGSMGIFTYRCTACNVNVCRECITHIPTSLVTPGCSSRGSPPVYRLDGLLTHVLDYMAQEDPGHFSVYAMSIAVNVSTRWKELPTSRVSDLPILSLVLDMVRSKAFALELVHHTSWLPPILSGLQLQTHSFLGGFFWGSTITEEPLFAPDASPREKQRVVTQLQKDFELYQQVLQQLVNVFLEDQRQHGEVVQAFLGWLACICETNSSGSRLEQGNDLSTDGFVINLSASLVSLTLDKWSTHEIDARYHQSRANRRAYGPHECCVGGAIDFSSFVDNLPKSEPTRLGPSFYKRLGHHYGVVCDVCGARDFRRVRYKCLNCQDYDLCDNCFDKLHRHRNHQDVDQAAATAAAAVDHDDHDHDNRRAHSESSSSTSSSSYHQNWHVFIRINIPIPLSLTRSFVPIPAEANSSASQADDDVATLQEEDKPRTQSTGSRVTPSTPTTPMPLNCLCCGLDLLQEQWFYQCAFCGFEHLDKRTPRQEDQYQPDPSFKSCPCRLICENCLLDEEAKADLNPFRMHRVGHQYVCIPTTPRMLQRCTQQPFLRLQQLLFPAALVPTQQFDVFTELFYLSVKSLHVGPLRTLSRLVAAHREILEVRSFCMQQEARQEQALSENSTGNGNAGLSAHYNSSKSRLKSLEKTASSVDLHLLLSSNVVHWIQFYSKICRWLLETQWSSGASMGSSPNGMNSWLPTTNTASSTSSPPKNVSLHAFPQHFFFDLCEVFFFVSTWQFREPCASQVNLVLKDRHVVEPLLVMLIHFVASDEVTRNPHLRLETLRSLCAFLGFLAKDKHRMAVVDTIFKTNPLFQEQFVTRCLHFHDQLEIYFVTNQNGFTLGNQEGANGGADSAFFLGKTSMVTMRVLMGSLLRFLAQFSVTHRQLERLRYCQRQKCACHVTNRVHNNDEFNSSATPEAKSFVLERFFNGFWGDLIGLMEEVQGKTGLLRHLMELQQSVARFGTDISLPFRPAMMEGYAALHWKHLRVLLCLLFEVVELVGWCSDVLAVKRMVLQKPQLFEKAAQAICFCVVTLVSNVHKSPNWQFSAELMAKARLLMALLVIVSVKWADLDKNCSMSCLWKLCSSHGMQIEQQVGDLEASSRWVLNSTIIRLESARFLGEMPRLSDEMETPKEEEVQDDQEEKEDGEALGIDVNEALEVLEHHSERASRRRRKQQIASKLSKRFVTSLSSDGRFDAKLFAVMRDLLFAHDHDQHRRRVAQEPTTSSEYCSIDECWLEQFAELTSLCREKLELHRELEASLGEIPEEFLDPLLSTLMTDPVRLPSGHVVDRNVIERHLGSSRSGVDPFTREPLTTEMLTPCKELLDRINAFVRVRLNDLAERNKHRQKCQEDLLATWGLGWDLIMSSDQQDEMENDDAEEGEEEDEGEEESVK